MAKTQQIGKSVFKTSWANIIAQAKKNAEKTANTTTTTTANTTTTGNPNDTSLQNTPGADAGVVDTQTQDPAAATTATSSSGTLVEAFYKMLGRGGSTGSDTGGTGIAAGGAEAIEGGNPGTVTGQGQVFDLINAANSQLGYKEGGNNDTKFGIWAGGNHNPWCAYFVSWCIDQAGLSSVFGGSKKEGLAGAYREKVTKGGGTLSETVAYAGDIIIWGTSGNSKHVGIVAKVEPQDGANWSQIYTIEGNCGDMVKVKKYTPGNVRKSGVAFAFGHPNWSNPGQVGFTPPASGISTSNKTT